MIEKQEVQELFPTPLWVVDLQPAAAAALNASLKAGHLGVKGNAFVVIANELKMTADQVSAGASRLKPILDRIERAAGDLKEMRDHGNPAQLTRLEPSILQMLQEIEAGNERLGRLMDRLVHEGAEPRPAG